MDKNSVGYTVGTFIDRAPGFVGLLISNIANPDILSILYA